MIETIVLHNFKSIRHVELDFRPINVLIGANGVGKSNLISLFKLLKNLQNDNLNTYVAENGYMDNLVYFGYEGEPFIQGQIVFSGELGKPSHRYELRLQKSKYATDLHHSLMTYWLGDIFNTGKMKRRWRLLNSM